VVLTGQLGEDGTVTFSLLRANARDGGFTGIAYGKREGAKIEGTMHTSTAVANVLREASFSLTKTGAK
jgi:hypothetical protein